MLLADAASLDGRLNKWRDLAVRGCVDSLESLLSSPTSSDPLKHYNCTVVMKHTGSNSNHDATPLASEDDILNDSRHDGSVLVQDANPRPKIFKDAGKLLERSLNAWALSRLGIPEPNAIARAIRQVCRHDRTTIVQRHNRRHSGYGAQLTTKEQTELSKLCTNLMICERCVPYLSVIVAILIIDLRY